MTTETRDTPLAWLRRHHDVILLGAILLAALALRLYQLEQDSFWLDELIQIRRSRLPFFAMIKDVLAEVGAVPIEYIITHFVYYYIGRSEGILRLPAVLWGVLSVATVYFLGKRMFDKTTGFLAAALLAAAYALARREPAAPESQGAHKPLALHSQFGRDTGGVHVEQSECTES